MQKPACSRNQFYRRWISIIYVVSDPFILHWPSLRLSLPKTSVTTMTKYSNQHQNYLTFCLPKIMRALIKKLEKRRKNINIWINSRIEVKKILVSPLLPALTVKLGRTYFRSYASTVIEKSTTQETTLSLEKTYPKTSISSNDLYLNNSY